MAVSFNLPDPYEAQKAEIAQFAEGLKVEFPLAIVFLYAGYDFLFGKTDHLIFEHQLFRGECKFHLNIPTLLIGLIPQVRNARSC